MGRAVLFVPCFIGLLFGIGLPFVGYGIDVKRGEPFAIWIIFGVISGIVLVVVTYALLRYCFSKEKGHLDGVGNFLGAVYALLTGICVFIPALITTLCLVYTNFGVY